MLKRTFCYLFLLFLRMAEWGSNSDTFYKDVEISSSDDGMKWDEGF